MTEQVGISAWRNQETATFWSWAEAERDEAPPAVQPLIAQETKRITVNRETAKEVAGWAVDVIGWAKAHPAPLRFSDRETGATLEPNEL